MYRFLQPCFQRVLVDSRSGSMVFCFFVFTYISSRSASHRFPSCLMSTDYLKRILTSKVYDVAVESPLEFAPQVSARIHNKGYLKREDTQAVFSFKLRGAYNKMANLSAADLKRGVIAASAGNHGQGVALAASTMGR